MSLIGRLNAPVTRMAARYRRTSSVANGNYASCILTCYRFTRMLLVALIFLVTDMSCSYGHAP
jgi:hypothetical protein